MSDDFQQRLAKIVNRVKSEMQSANDAADAADAKLEAQKALVDTVIKDWNGRIAPLVIQAVQAANQGMAEAEIFLKGWESIAGGGGGDPSMPNLPNITICLERNLWTGEPITPLRVRYLNGEEDAAAADLPSHAEIVIGVSAAGGITVCPMNSAIAGGCFSAGEFDQTKIEAIVADFIDEQL
jgi:hypothetical protein